MTGLPPTVLQLWQDSYKDASEKIFTPHDLPEPYKPPVTAGHSRPSTASIGNHRTRALCSRPAVATRLCIQPLQTAISAPPASLCESKAKALF